jgi:hypothetical protein
MLHSHRSCRADQYESNRHKLSFILTNRSCDIAAQSYKSEQDRLLLRRTGKAKEFFRTAAILPYMLQKNTVTKAAYLIKIYYRLPYQDLVCSGASVVSTSLLRASAVLLLLIVGNVKCTTLG